MPDKKDTDKHFDTCFENTPFAELMQNMIGRQGVGSLCAEVMKKVLEPQKDGRNLNWAEIMQEVVKECDGVQEEPEKSKKEVCHGRKES
jgi:hypothetical protein